MSAEICDKAANSVQVCIKLRPCEPGQSSFWQVKEGRSIQQVDSHAEPSVFDYVFDEDAGNQEVFDRMAQHIVRACMQGFNGIIFAYGQTLSGKTHTMMGDDQNPGVMGLAAKEIFQILTWETKRDFLLRASYIEIYNEKINDLLDKRNQDIKLYEAGNGVVKISSEECIITSEDDLMRLISSGNKERTLGGAHTPERSGHSHAILRIIIESWKSDGSDMVLHSILNLVDLAGFERSSGGLSHGSRATSGVHINKSLMFLGNVVKHLSNSADNKYISFRDCKLTRFLQASLCGNAFASIICTIKSWVIEESQSTLNFAMGATKIRINPQLNKMSRGTTMMEQLANEIKELQDQLAEEKQKKDNELKVQTLKSKLRAEKLKIIRCHPFMLKRRSNSSSELERSKTTDESEVSMDKDKDSMPKCGVPQAEISALTASNPLHQEQVKALKQIIARLEMENSKSVNLKQQFDTHKAQSKQLETHLLTTINKKDLTIEELQQSLKELSRDVVRIESMQAEYQVIQQKYNKLQEEYESLERTSNASEEQCQKLQTDNARLQLEIGTLKERVEEAKRKLLEAPSQEVLAEEIKVQRECQTADLISFHANFEEFHEKQIKSEISQANATDGSPLKGLLKQEFQEQLETDEKKRLCNIIYQLEKEVEGKNSLNKATEATKCSLQNALSENRGLVIKVEELQHKVEYLEKQKDDLQGTGFGESTMSESMLQLPPNEDTLVAPYISPVKPSQEVIVLRATVAELKAIVCDMQTETARHLKQMQLKDSIIAELKDEIDKLLIGKLQDKNDKLASAEYEKQIKGLTESLSKAKEELKLQEKQKTDGINALRVEHFLKMKISENANGAKFREYAKELEESKDRYEREVATWKDSLLLKEKLLEALRSQLESVSNEHKELEASSKEQIQELKQKYDQMAIYTDNLREEKSILQIKIDEADAQHSITVKQLHELEHQIDGISRQNLTEKSDFNEKLETLTAKIEDLETELQSARLKAAGLDDLISEHEELKLSLAQATVVSSTLQEKVESLQAQLLASEREISSRDLEKAQLGSKLKLALEEKDAASAEQLALTEQLQAVEEKMASQAGKFEKELADLNSSMNELLLKLKSVQELKDNLESENDELKVKLRNAHNLRGQLEEEQKQCATLRTQFTELKASKTQLEEQLANKEAEFNRKLLEMSHQVELGAKECDKLRCDLETKTKSFQSEKEVLNSSISTLSKEKKLLEERISSFNQNDDRNAELNAKLKAKEAELKSLREASINQKLVADEADIKCRQYMEQKVELTNEIEKLRTTLKSKEASILTERERLNATISSLLEDKRNLGEKQCTLYERVSKLENELSALQAINRCNSSVESNDPPAPLISVKPRTLNNLEPKPYVDAGVVKKSSIIEYAVRREKRKTAHDEHRKQSFWNDFRDFGTMTDPEVCRGTARNMELIKNPLKAENRQLRLRMFKEHQKATIEQKRLRRKIHDLTTRIANPTDSQTVDSEK
ncbi:hypothetical protein KR032_006979 [Drosophila birchii]|nr:hypothetical protein KR032_006979 [Drosophila birchii]